MIMGTRKKEAKSRNCDNNELFLDTGEHCFLCLASTSQGSNRKMTEQRCCSFSYLSSYLKLNVSNCLSEDLVKVTDSDVEENVKNSRFSISVCKGCGSKLEYFSDLFLQLKSLQMKVTSCLEAINRKMETAEDIDLVRKYRYDTPQKLMLIRLAQSIRKATKHSCATRVTRLSEKLTTVKREEEDISEYSESDDKSDSDDDELLDEESQPSPEDSDDYEDGNDVALPLETVLGHESSNAKGLRSSCSSKLSPAAKARRGRKKHICEHCGKVFGRSEHLKRHRETVHLKLKKFECSTCFQQFYDRSHFNRHLKNLHGVVPEEVGTPVESIPVHEKTYSVDPKTRKFVCIQPQCRKEFIDRSSVRFHYRSIHLNIRFNCSSCSKLFRRKSALANHLQKCKGVTAESNVKAKGQRKKSAKEKLESLTLSLYPEASESSQASSTEVQ